jgi:hypothetical protein
MFFIQVIIIFYQKFFLFKYCFKLNLIYNWHVRCKGVKLWSLHITIFKEIKSREQGQHLNIPKKISFICLLYYNYSSNR